MPARRTNGDGSFRKRADGRWECRIVLANGARRSVYGATRAEAKARAEALRRRSDIGLDVLTPDQTLAVFLHHWLEDAARPAIRPTTFESYESIIRVRILPELGRMKLTAVTAQHLQAFYKKLRDAGLGPASIVRTHAVLHSAFKQAMRWDLILRNPADLVRPPTVPRQEMKALTGAEVSKLLEAATDPTVRTLYAVAATAGLRRGELLGLRWTDIDFERAVITVQRTAQRIRGEGIVYGEPKTNAGRRSVRIGALAVQHLRNQRTHQLEQRLRAGPAWVDLGLVFSSAVGTAIEEARVTRTFQRDLERAELPRVRLHDLRHTAATLLISQGVSMKAVQATLGHSTIATTMDVYAHVTPSMQDSVSEAMDRVFAAAAQPIMAL